jgi:hypothetical protein
VREREREGGKDRGRKQVIFTYFIFLAKIIVNIKLMH